MLITGCHRSGTSLLAAVAAQCVVEKRSNDLKPLVDNPKGYFESHKLRDCNDYLLSSLGYSWHQPPLQPLNWQIGSRLQLLVAHRPQFKHWGTSSDWLDKDPRLCLTFGAFEHILLRRVPLAISLRSPHEVALSLYRRDGISYEKGLMIWWLYNRALSIVVRPGDPVVLYRELLEWPGGSSRQNMSLEILWNWLNQFLDNKSSLGTSPEELRRKSLDLIEPTLQRSDRDLELDSWITTKLSTLCTEIYINIEQTQGHERWSVMQECFDGIPGWLANHYEDTIQIGAPDLEHYRIYHSDNTEVINAELTAMTLSTSWKITKPLRWLGDRLKNRDS